MDVREMQERDFEWVLTLNNDNLPAVSELSVENLRHLIKIADRILIAEEDGLSLGVLILMREGHLESYPSLQASASEASDASAAALVCWKLVGVGGVVKLLMWSPMVTKDEAGKGMIGLERSAGWNVLPKKLLASRRIAHRMRRQVWGLK